MAPQQWLHQPDVWQLQQQPVQDAAGVATMRAPGAQGAGSQRRFTIVLDLDETLVHSTLDDAPGAEAAHFHFPVPFNGAEHMVHVRTRPHMRRFLEHAAGLFEVVVFTASQKVYAEKVRARAGGARQGARAARFGG